MPFLDDLLLPSYYALHQRARVRLFLLLAIVAASFTGVGLYYHLYSVSAIVLATLASFFAVAVPSIHFFTNQGPEVVKAWDDLIHPPTPITLDPVTTFQAERNRLMLEINQLIQNNIENSILQTLKDKLKRLFNLRSFAALSNESLSEIKKEFNEKYAAFSKKEDWYHPENLQELKSLMIQAVFCSDAILARMEQDMQESNVEMSTENIAAWVKDQDKRYCYDLIYSGVIDLYHRARGKVIFQIDKLDHYAAGTDQAVLRQAYNTFVKEGFYQRYGSKAFKYAMSRQDQRFVHWSTTDTKNNKEFSAVPDTRPT